MGTKAKQYGIDTGKSIKINIKKIIDFLVYIFQHNILDICYDQVILIV